MKKIVILTILYIHFSLLMAKGGIHPGGVGNVNHDDSLELSEIVKVSIPRPKNISDSLLADAFSVNDTGKQIIITHPCAPGTHTPDQTRPIRSYSVHTMQYKGPGSYEQITKQNEQLLLFGYMIAETVMLTAAAPYLLPEAESLAFASEVGIGVGVAAAFAPGEDEGIKAVTKIPDMHIDYASPESNPIEFLLINNKKGSIIEVTKTATDTAMQHIDYIKPGSGTYKLPYNDETTYTFKPFTGEQETLEAQKLNSLQHALNGAIILSNQSGHTVAIYRINNDGTQTHVHSIHADKQFYQLQCDQNYYYLLKMYAPETKKGIIKLKTSQGKITQKQRLKTLSRNNNLTSGYDIIKDTNKQFKNFRKKLKQTFR